MIQVEIYLEDKEAFDRKGKFLSSIKVAPIEGIPSREVVNNSVIHIKTWLMGIYNNNLIISISE